MSSVAEINYRPDIDGLRGISILAVLLFHAFPEKFTGGFIGVDIFFVISGYLISTIIFKEINDNKFSLIYFYFRRIKRLFPALITVLITCFIFGWFLLLTDEFISLNKHISAGASFVANFVFYSESGYFDSNSFYKPLLHLWSLSVEEQFYLFWPILIVFLWKRYYIFFFSLISLLIISFSLSVLFSALDKAHAFFLPHTRFWELLLGTLLALLNFKKINLINYSINKLNKFLLDFQLIIKKNLVENILSSLGFILIIFGFFYIDKDLKFWIFERDIYFPGILALIPTLGTLLVIIGGTKSYLNKYLLGNRYLLIIGLISYPLYLWHWPIFSFISIIESNIHYSLTLKFFGIFLSFFLAFFTYKFIECPIRFNSPQNSNCIPLILFFIIIFISLFSFLNYKFKFLNSRLVNNNFDYATHWTGWEDCDNNNLTITKIKDYGCKSINNNKPVDIFVIGDSHAGHLASGFKDFYNSSKKNVRIALAGGCNPVYVNSDIKKLSLCEAHMKNSFDYAIKNESVKNVVISSYAQLYIQGDRLYFNKVRNEKLIERNLIKLEKNLDLTFQKILNSGKNVIFVINNPELINHPITCVSRLWYKNECNLNVPINIHNNRNIDYYELINKFKNKYPSISFTNTFNEFCDENFCYGNNDKEIWYQTRDHLSPDGSKKLVKSFSDLLK